MYQLFEKYITNFPIGKSNFLWIYPGILIYGTIINTLVFSPDSLDKQKNTHYLLEPGNIINKIFAYNGNKVFLTLFLSIMFIKIWYRKTKQLLYCLPTANNVSLEDYNSNEKADILRIIKEYLIKLLLKYFVLYILFFIIDHVFILTGGTCSVGNGSVKDALECKDTYGGEWRGGFDISGHFCFLTNLSLIFWFEIRDFSQILQENWKPWLILKCLIISVLSVWIVILSITAIYYHTLWEKILGVLFGYGCPTVMYLLVPKYNKKIGSFLYE
ncbi:Yft2p SCDLUD_004581 [Saccharomycodes ludwigii]|uniref:Yft2p n=1 Tax=Saccharomycodes ludwigii TaxID=36035 RepID=UPI001E88E8A5|nr:hypothetical protein SCDLUD_004581 [Saccharomycodes ludwigii]KAH3899153.1 hypothetical protein SCDLUD_004581 [Saccharomycodes ludwigii]